MKSSTKLLTVMATCQALIPATAAGREVMTCQSRGDCTSSCPSSSPATSTASPQHNLRSTRMLDSSCGTACSDSKICKDLGGICTLCDGVECYDPTQCGKKCRTDEHCGTKNGCWKCDGVICIRPPTVSKCKMPCLDDSYCLDAMDFCTSCKDGFCGDPSQLILPSDTNSSAEVSTCSNTSCTMDEQCSSSGGNCSKCDITSGKCVADAADGPNAPVQGLNCHSTESSLRSAIDDAMPGTTIKLCTGNPIDVRSEIMITKRGITIECEDSTGNHSTLRHIGQDRFFTFTVGGGTLSNIHFVDGFVRNEDGGAVRMYGHGNTVKECYFFSNHASGGRGGAIFMDFRGSLQSNRYHGNTSAQCSDAFVEDSCVNH